MAQLTSIGRNRPALGAGRCFALAPRRLWLPGRDGRSSRCDAPRGTAACNGADRPSAARFAQRSTETGRPPAAVDPKAFPEGAAGSRRRCRSARRGWSANLRSWSIGTFDISISPPPTGTGARGAEHEYADQSSARAGVCACRGGCRACRCQVMPLCACGPGPVEGGGRAQCFAQRRRYTGRQCWQMEQWGNGTGGIESTTRCGNTGMPAHAEWDG